MNEELKELVQAFEDFKRMPFPEDSDDDEASQLHAELAEYDSFIAGIVSTLLEGGRVSPHLLKFDDDLKTRLEKVARESRQPAASSAEEYLRYLDALRRLIDLACVRVS